LTIKPNDTNLLTASSNTEYSDMNLRWRVFRNVVYGMLYTLLSCLSTRSQNDIKDTSNQVAFCLLCATYSIKFDSYHKDSMYLFFCLSLGNKISSNFYSWFQESLRELSHRKSKKTTGLLRNYKDKTLKF